MEECPDLKALRGYLTGGYAFNGNDADEIVAAMTEMDALKLQNERLQNDLRMQEAMNMEQRKTIMKQEAAINCAEHTHSFDDKGHEHCTIHDQVENLKKNLEREQAHGEYARVTRDKAIAELQESNRLIRRWEEAVNMFCSCGGGEPGHGCAMCDAYHWVKETATERPIALCPKCGMRSHDGGCDLKRKDEPEEPEHCTICGDRYEGGLHECGVSKREGP